MRDERLIRLVLSDDAGQQTLDAFLQNWDLEHEGSRSGLILAIFKQQHPELDFHMYSGPRLDGLVNYFRFKNLSMLSEAARIAKDNRSRGKDYAVSGNCAMRLRVPQNPRFSTELAVLDSAALRKSIYKPMADMILSRASEVELSGTKINVISAEDLFAMRMYDFGMSVAYVWGYECEEQLVCDLYYILLTDESFDWNTVVSYSRLKPVRKVASYVLTLLDTFHPGIVPSEVLGKVIGLADSYNWKLCADFKSDVVLPAFIQRSDRTIKGAKRLVVVLKFKILKRLQGHPALIRLLTKKERNELSAQ